MFCSSNNIHVAPGESRRISSASVELLLEHSGEVVIGQTQQLLSTSTTDLLPRRLCGGGWRQERGGDTGDSRNQLQGGSAPPGCAVNAAVAMSYP